VRNRIINDRSRQSGAILIISLLLLLVLTVLGVVMMQTTRMQERMGGNTRDLNAALQGAESGLRYGEGILAGYTAAPDTSGTLPCVVCQKGTLPVAIYDPAQFSWTANAQPYGNPGTLGLFENPQYIIEELAFVPDSLDVGNESSDGREFYAITSHSTGASGIPNTVVQSTYARRF
jgi:type IV pilus assembly protein PilX